MARLFLFLIIGLIVGSGNEIRAFGTLRPPDTFIMLSAIDSTTGDFIAGPVTISVVEEDNGNVLREYNFLLLEANQTFVVTWSKIYMDLGARIQLTASKEGFRTGLPFLYEITEESPDQGLLFTHIFLLEPIGTDRPMIRTESVRVERNGEQFNLEIVTTSELLGIGYNESSNSITFAVSEGRERGILNLTIPHDLMEGPFTVLIDDILIHSAPRIENENNTILQLTYSSGFHEIVVNGKITGLLVEERPLRISLTISSESMQISETLELTGVVEPLTQAREDVILKYEDPDGAVMTHLVAILPDGSFRDSFSPTVSGPWTVSAETSDSRGQEASAQLSFEVLGVVNGQEQDEPGAREDEDIKH